MVIDFDQNRKIPSILSLLSKAKIRIGFDNNGKGKAYTNPIKYEDDEYECQSFVNLLKPFGIRKKIQEKDILLRHETKDKNKIGVYACAMKPGNRLSIQQWVKIIKKKGKNYEYIFFGGKSDKNRYDAIQSGLDGYDVFRKDGCSLAESLDEISKIGLMLSEDGGTYHMAVCAGTPTISYWLNGKLNMKKWKSPFKKHKAIMVEK